MKFGQYELLELIAVGGMAEVFKGRVVGAEGFEKYVAIKRILPDLAEDERFVKMLLTEARIHSALSHRNIVQIHDLGISEDGQYFIVLEFVEGYDLRMITEQLTAQGEIVPEVLSLHIASELAQALHFAHEARGPDGQRLGLVHRDVTPSNVLISFAGEVKLSDFGLAKRRHDRSVVGSLKGNLSYMSPEQANQAPLDSRTDIFSLGAVLFEMLTGRRLREITTNEVAAWSHVASGAVLSARQVRPDLPVSIERLLDRALAADPGQRFPDAAAFGSAIREVLTEMNVAVGASDLGALLGALDPPRRPRHLMMERSRVIRLGPEALALREAFAAQVTPAPLGGSPAPAPGEPAAASPPRTAPAAASPPRTAPAATSSRGPAAPTAADPDATPPPLAPTRTRAPTPMRTRSRTPLLPGSQASARPPSQIPGGPRLTPSERAAVPQRRMGGTTPAWGTAPSGSGPIGAASGPRPGSGRFPTAPAFGFERPHRDTARVQIRSSGRFRGVLMMLVLALLGGLAVVHYYLVPLDVLVVWRDPAALAIATDPEGADLHLDGTSLPRQSPTTAKVQRDLFDHVVEATSPGYLPARAKIRYDKSVGLSCLVRLKRDPLAAAAQAANVPTAAAPAPEPGASARTADPAPAPTPSTAPARR